MLYTRAAGAMPAFRYCRCAAVLLSVWLRCAVSSRIEVDGLGAFNVDGDGDPDEISFDEEEPDASNISDVPFGPLNMLNDTSTVSFSPPIMPDVYQHDPSDISTSDMYIMDMYMSNISDVHIGNASNRTILGATALVDEDMCCSCPTVSGRHDNRDECEEQCTEDGQTTCQFGEAAFCVTVPCSDPRASARQCSRSSAPCLDCEQDSDRCLQHRPHWGEAYTCASSSLWCAHGFHYRDMLECCPATCTVHGADMCDTPCKPLPPSGERLGFSVRHATRMASFANAAYCGPTPELEAWACGAANMSGIEVNGSLRLISADGFGYEHRRFAFVARLPGLTEADPAVEGLPLSAPENDGCRQRVEFAFSVGRHANGDAARRNYGHMKELAGVPYENATLGDFHRLFFCGGDGVDAQCGAPPVTCSTPPCGACPVNPPPFTGGGCMVAFRGSNNYANFVSDALALHINLTDPFHHEHVHPCYDCTVEEGFHNVYHSLAKGVFNALSELGCGPNRDVFITGHSLGAAVGTIAAAHLDAAGYNIKAAYLFESPRVGNKKWARWFMQELGDRDIFRTSHRKDPVPDGPPTWMDFEHIGREVFFEHSGTAEDPFYVCEDDYECEHFKSSHRLSTGDHCKMPLVPGGDFCFCEKFEQF